MEENARRMQIRRTIFWCRQEDLPARYDVPQREEILIKASQCENNTPFNRTPHLLSLSLVIRLLLFFSSFDFKEDNEKNHNLLFITRLASKAFG